ncbi:uncharacterized protein RJT20DRAFT_22787 [Scheffersomyces xylosifermentans]|uniref:uncharacterized protein n=1 Tax=Scheffersomyces xylosifermentans TaxID=1304137 RepID=UPI00315CA7E5
MSSGWAAKLATPTTNSKQSSPTATNTSSANSPNSTNNSRRTNSGQASTKGKKNTTNKESTPNPHPSERPSGAATGTPQAVAQAESFNAKEVLAYLNSTYNSYLAQAKNDKSGESVKVYRSLESNSQWKTKSSNGGANNSNGSGNKNRYNPKDVIRNSNSGNNSDTLDLVFEINRSIYQQQREQKEQSK